jgi:hypothetical protein
LCALTNTAPAPKKEGEDQAIGRSKGVLSTKIHATVNALGNPTGFLLTPGQAHDLPGSDELLPTPADKAYDADEGVIEPLRGLASCTDHWRRSLVGVPQYRLKILNGALGVLDRFALTQIKAFIFLRLVTAGH